MGDQYINEDELPKSITDEQYAAWFKLSWIPDGVGCRVGPPVDLDGNLLTPTPVAGLPEGDTPEEIAEVCRAIDYFHTEPKDRPSSNINGCRLSEAHGYTLASFAERRLRSQATATEGK